MTLKIIVGTLFDITDPTGELLSLYQNGVFMKQIWDGTKWKSYNSGVISFDRAGNKINVVQETGAGKTVLLAIFAFRAHKRGRNIGGNLRFAWTKNNLGKPQEEWRPAIRCIGDIEKANNIDLEIDDVYGTITAWNCDEADFIRTAALLARKSFVNINFTAQFTTNQIPPDLRRITGEYHIPFIRCLDATRKSPDGHYFPLEIIDLKFNGFFQYKGYKVYDLQSDTGLEILNGYDTLEVSTPLKADGSPNEAIGIETENKATEYLQNELPQCNVIHVGNIDGGFDIESECAFFDTVNCNPSRFLATHHKNLNDLLSICKDYEKPGYIMYETAKNKWHFIKITKRLYQMWHKKDINLKRLRSKTILTIDDIKSEIEIFKKSS